MFTRQDGFEYLAKPYLWLWICLAFQAGAVNAGGFLACARFVSHMTGFGTMVGVSLADFDYVIAIEMLSAPLSFMAGAMVSAIAVDSPMLKGQSPRYRQVMLGMILIFAFVAIGGQLGLFGVFGEPLRYQRDFALMSLLCFACGMQNACFGSLTRGQIRTTHLTGILTDIGVTFVRLIHFDSRTRESIRMKRMNFIRMMTFVSFSTGSAIFTLVFGRMGYAGFGILTVLASTILSVTIYQQHQLQIRRAAAQSFRVAPAPAFVARDKDKESASLST